eukprot:TRINITY_DN19318_c0_g1_i1.p1 TRINITY_DN19318_c0_g1~~TRINITY_DN19318_c0_g1_i1.p1  ORF type:complete len:1037 (+),score=238.66 TRINITY_DN19318_c0_g1_i1:45-3155(+)
MSDGQRNNLAVRSTASYLLQKVPVVKPGSVAKENTPRFQKASVQHQFEEVPEKEDVLGKLFPWEAKGNEAPKEHPPSKIFPWDGTNSQKNDQGETNTMHGKSHTTDGVPARKDTKYSDWGVATPPEFARFDPTQLKQNIEERLPQQDHNGPPHHHDHQHPHHQHQYPHHPHHHHHHQHPHHQHQHQHPHHQHSPHHNHHQPQELAPQFSEFSPTPRDSTSHGQTPFSIHSGYTPRSVRPPAPPFPSPTFNETWPYKPSISNAIPAESVATPSVAFPPSMHREDPQHVEQPIDVNQVADILRAANVLPRRSTTPVQPQHGVPGGPSPMEPLVTGAVQAPQQAPPSPILAAQPTVTNAPKFELKQRFSDTEKLNVALNEKQRFPSNSQLPLTEHKHPINSVERTVLLRGDGKVGVTFNETPDGVFISGLVPGGNAEKDEVPDAGRIVSINGIRIRGTEDLGVAKEISEATTHIVVDVGVTQPSAKPKDPEEGIGREVTAISDGQRLVRLVQSHPGLSCNTDEDIASYVAIKGCRGIVTDQDLEDATVMVNFPGPELQAWLPLTAVIEYKLKAASQKLPSVAGRDYSISPQSDLPPVHAPRPRKVTIRDPELAASNLPFVHPDDDPHPADTALDLQVLLSKYPEDRKLQQPVVRDLSPERAKQDMLDRIDALGLLGDMEAADGVGDYEYDPEGLPAKRTEEFFQYGFDPKANGIYLQEKSPNERRTMYHLQGTLVNGDDHKRETYLYPPPHYPAGLDSDEGSIASNESQGRGRAPSMLLDPEDEEYLKKLEVFQDEMEDYYKKAGVEEYRKFVESMLINKTCPEELESVYRKQLERIKQGKNPFKHRRRKDKEKEKDPSYKEENVGKPETPPPAPLEEPANESKTDPKPEKEKKEPEKKASTKKKSKKEAKKEEEGVKKPEETVVSPVQVQQEQPDAEEEQDEDYKQKLAEFEEQMDSYFKAAGKDAYQTHLDALFKNNQVPPELVDDYTEQLELLKEGKDHTATKRQRERRNESKKKKKDGGEPKKKKSSSKKKNKPT